MKVSCRYKIYQQYICYNIFFIKIKYKINNKTYTIHHQLDMYFVDFFRSYYGVEDQWLLDGERWEIALKIIKENGIDKILKISIINDMADRGIELKQNNVIKDLQKLCGKWTAINIEISDDDLSED